MLGVLELIWDLVPSECLRESVLLVSTAARLQPLDLGPDHCGSQIGDDLPGHFLDDLARHLPDDL